MEEEKSGITLSDIFRIIFSQKWLALFITVVITLGIAFGLYFGYNPSVTNYVSTFTVSFPGSEDANPKFPDNSPFNYREIISRDNLNAAKASDEERFGYIQVGAMYENKDISIIRTTNSQVTGQEEFSYTIKVSQKYFKGRSDATDFIDALAQMPVNYLIGLAEDQDAYLVDYDQTDFYEDKTDILTSQVEYLMNGVSSLAENTGNSTVSMQIWGALNRYNIKLQAAIGKMRTNHYVHDVEEVKTVYPYLINNIDTALESRRTELKEIRKGGLDETDDTIIVQTSVRVEQIAAEISKLEEQKKLYSEYYLDGKTNEDFDSELTELGEELKALTIRFSDNLRGYYNRYSFIAYNGALDTAGNLNAIVCVLIGLVVGLVVAAIVAFIVGNKKHKKTLKQSASTVNQSPDSDSSKEN